MDFLFSWSHDLFAGISHRNRKYSIYKIATHSTGMEKKCASNGARNDFAIESLIKIGLNDVFPLWSKLISAKLNGNGIWQCIVIEWQPMSHPMVVQTIAC